MTPLTIALVSNDALHDELTLALRATAAHVFTSPWVSVSQLLARQWIDACVLGEEHVVERCHALRELGFRSAIIVRATQASAAREVDALDAGADDYWFGSDPESLLARIRATLRRCATATLRVDRVGYLVVDGEDANVDGQRCLLTRRELSLLHLLIHHAGKVVTRQQVLGHWGLGAVAQEGNFIDVHVMRLRRKLGRAGKLLETVRGHGLCLHDESARHTGTLNQERERDAHSATTESSAV